MISSSKDKVGSSSSTKQEGINTSTQGGKNKTTTNVKASSSISTSSPWSRLKDSRIVRVSRAFGGKDRHSKVCTIRGLRDRRVRLSVPTAIQLYDLQDRLGVNQPSKVVDWLLNVAKDEIDELPPLPIPPGSFPHLIAHQARLSTGTRNSLELGSSCSKQEFKNMMNNSTTSTSSMNWEENGDDNAGFWNSKGVGRRDIDQDLGNEKGNWMSTKRDDHEDKQEMISNEVANSSSSFLNRGGLNFPYGTAFFQLESQSFNPLSSSSSSSSSSHHHIGSSSSGHLVPFPSPLSLSSTSYFPNSASSMEIDARQITHFQMLTNSSPTPYSIAQSMRPFHFSMSQPPDDHHKHNHDQEFDQN